MYRKNIIVGIILVFFLSACVGQNSTDLLANQESVRLFLAMQPDAKPSQTELSDDGSGLFDLAKTECPAIGNGPVTRVSHAGKTGTLITYMNDTDILCSILNPKDGPRIEHKMRSEAPEESVAMVVNGQTVPWEKVQQAIAQIPAGTDEQSASQQAFSTVLNTALLEYEASLISVSEEEIAESKAEILQEQAARQIPLTDEQIVYESESRAKLKKLLNERLLLADLSVSDEQAQRFYLENTNLFLRGELAVMRQIFISTAGRDTDARDALIQQIATELPKTDFCQLVRQYSDDSERKEQCGTYIVPRGILPPQLEQASFGTPANQTTVVLTESGAHLVQTVEVLPAQVVPFAQVREEVRSTMANNGLQERLSLYLLLLRSNADVIVYDGEDNQS